MPSDECTNILSESRRERSKLLSRATAASSQVNGGAGVGAKISKYSMPSFGLKPFATKGDECLAKTSNFTFQRRRFTPFPWQNFDVWALMGLYGCDRLGQGSADDRDPSLSSILFMTSSIRRKLPWIDVQA